jgi:hypothetical protein
MNLSDMWQTWLKATTSPSEITYEELRQKPDARLSTALIWMVIYGAIAAVIGLISSIMFAGAANSAVAQLMAQPELDPELRAQIELFANSGMLGGLGAANIGSIVWVPIGFLIGTGILHLIARLFGGQGEFGRFAYLNAAFQAPLGILVTLLSLIPFVGCITPIISIYQIVLAYFAVKVEHQLTSGKAIIVVLLPLIVVLVLFGCLFISLFGMIMGLQNQ